MECFYLKQDGSLTDEGVEIVSQPMTYNFITQSGDWKFVFNQMKSKRNERYRRLRIAFSS